VFDAFARYQEMAPRLMMPSFFGLRWLRPFWLAGRSRVAAAGIRGLLVQMIRPRFDAARAPGFADDGPDDILASLLRVRDEATGQGFGFGFEELVDQVAMLFLAGHETSASALSWALHLLAHRPDLQERLHAEAMTHLDPDSDDPGALRDLELARNVFRETLRLFPPVGFLARQCGAPRTMRDKHLAPGDTVVVSPWLIHRHRELWARPDEFDPDRYDGDPASGASSDGAGGGCPIPHDEPSARESLRRAYLPFGLGPRVCIGAAFAQQEAALVIGALAREFRFEPVAGDVPEPVGRLTIRAEDGIRLHVVARPDRGTVPASPIAQVLA
jgi:cytochrome P450